ncbi:MAG: hypothetical protein ACOCSK_00825, partial [Rhodothermales bacterium]
GIFLEKRDGVLLAGSQREADLIDTATRHLNRGIVSIFTDAIVPTVGLVGSDRGLLHAEGKDVTIREADWVFDIIRRGCIPVIAARAAVSERADVPVDPVVVIRALSMAWAGRVEIAMFTTTNLPGIMQGSVPLSWCDLEEAEVAQVASDGRALKALVNQGHTVLLTNTLRYGQPEELRGTIVSEQRP